MLWREKAKIAPLPYCDKRGGGRLLALLQSFFSLPPELMTALGTVLGFAMLGDLTADQQDSLGNFLILIGQILETSSTQKQIFEDQASAQTIAAMQQELQSLRKAVESLQKN